MKNDGEGTRISLLTIANNKEIMQDFRENLASQIGVDYELLACDNFGNHISSAREALNHLAEKAVGDYLVFLHPDIRFLDPYSLHDLIEKCRLLEDSGVIGVAGSPEKIENGDRIILSSIFHGEDKKPAGISISEPTEVQTVDECLFIVRRTLFLKTGFSDLIGFHMYAVELCLDMILNGYKNYVVPADVWHMSDGKSLSPDYVKCAKIIVHKYKNNFKNINTTVKRWKTEGAGAELYLDFYFLKQIIKKKIRRKTER